MASTRDINAPGNYAMEQDAMKKERLNLLYPHAANGHAVTTQLPGTGLLPARVGSAQLSSNYVDIESRLYGISSTNLVEPLPTLTPDVFPLLSLDIHERIPVVHPPRFEIIKEQRLRLFHSDQYQPSAQS